MIVSIFASSERGEPRPGLRCTFQMFLSAILSFILYTLVFLRMRGNIVVNGLHIRFRLAKSESLRGRLYAQSYALKIARQMLLYVCYPSRWVSGS